MDYVYVCKGCDRPLTRKEFGEFTVAIGKCEPHAHTGPFVPWSKHMQTRPDAPNVRTAVA